MTATAQPVTMTLRAKLFRGLSDPCRLVILEALRDGPLTVGELVAVTGRSQSNTSNHLACLLDCDLVVREQRGRHAVYSLADERVATLLAVADAVIADVAAGLYACTHYEPREDCCP
ncbi:MAG TPA: metalloregulator ArsR/SmtB family transcription factor [Thermomicrobiales bacterium]|nr:metalloregulator ArsR/SmtB family transcription factor [Thermomicrobiales bacterium]